MSDTQNINVTVTANTIQLRSQLAQAQAQITAFRAQLAQLQAQNVGSPATAQMQELGTKIASSNALIAALRAQLAAAATQMGILGGQTAFLGRAMTALIDESIAGRWRQFDGSLARVVGHFIAINPLITAQIAAVAALAGGVGILAYQWHLASEAERLYLGEQLVKGTLGPQSVEQVANLRSELSKLNVGRSTINDIVKELGAASPATSMFRDRIAQTAAALAAVTQGDPAKIIKQMVDDFNQGAQGVEKWANSTMALSEQQKAHFQGLRDGKKDIDAMREALDMADRTFGLTGSAIAKNRQELKELSSTIIPGDQFGHIDEDAVNKARNIGPTEVQPDMAGAQRNAMQEQLDAEAYQKKIQSLDKDLAAEKDFADRRVPILQNKLTTTLAYAGTETKESIQLERELEDAKRQASDEAMRIKLAEIDVARAANRRGTQSELEADQQKLAVLKQFGKEGTVEWFNIQAQLARDSRAGADSAYEYQIAKFKDLIQQAQGNAKEQLRIEDELLAFIKAKYGERSKQYEQESRERVRIEQAEAREIQTIAQQNANTQRELGRLINENNAANLKATQKQSGIGSSILDSILGTNVSGVKAEFDKAMGDLQASFAVSATKIRTEMADAVSGPAFNKALNDSRIATQQFLNQRDALIRNANQRVALEWKQMADSIASSLSHAIIGMVSGTQTATQGLLNLFSTFGNLVLTSLLKIPAEWLASWIATQLGLTAVHAEDVMSAKATGEAIVFIHAGEAFAAAFAATSAIPIIGPELAPGVAAAAYAAALAGGQFAEGKWNVPHDMMAVIHAGESVVPADFASNLRQSGTLDGGGSGGGSPTNVHVSMPITTMDAASFASTINAHADTIAQVVRRAMTSNPSLRPKWAQ